MTRDLMRRVERLEAEQPPAVICLWAGERSADEVMLERFGDTDGPPGALVYVYRWSDKAAEIVQAVRSGSCGT